MRTSSLTARTRARSVVKSVGRVFEVLEVFNEVRKPMAAIDIARALVYPPSSTAALLKSMVAEIEAIVRRVNAGGREAQVDGRKVLATVAEVRARGYARSYGTYVAGSGIIAMNLAGTVPDRRVAIGAGGPVDRLKAREHEIVRGMRRAIGRHFGSP